MTTQRVPLAGVVGWPIAHSKSPAIHGHWLNRYEIKGYYVPVGIEPKNFETAIKTLPDLGFVGANITIPFKERALDIADNVSERAALIGASNTISFKPDGKITADNTDGIGFLNNLKQTAPDWDATTGDAVVLGAGGAARAVISALLAAGTPQVVVANRTPERAEALRRHFGKRVLVSDLQRASDHLATAATIVNSTSLGMVGQPPLDFDLSSAPSNALVSDIVYNPLQTDLLKQATALGLTVVDGLGMLLHQAAPGFEKWFGKQPSVDDELRKIVLDCHV